jgi:hypothetical protein
MSGARLTVRGAEDLALLSRPRWARGIGSIVLEIDAASDDPAAFERPTAAINRELRACGCVTAAMFTVAALASLPAAGALPSASLPGDWWRWSALAFGYVLAAALVGKIVGLIVSEIKLARRLRELDRLLGGFAPRRPSERSPARRPVTDRSAVRRADSLDTAKHGLGFPAREGQFTEIASPFAKA